MKDAWIEKRYQELIFELDVITANINCQMDKELEEKQASFFKVLLEAYQRHCKGVYGEVYTLGYMKKEVEINEKIVDAF